MDKSDCLSFDLSPKTQSVRLSGPEGEVRYVLKEADEAAYIRWKDARLAANKWDPDQKTMSFDEGGHTEALLVASCLRSAADPEGAAISLATVKTWPCRVVRRLFAAVTKMSGLTATGDYVGDEDAEKNSPAATPAPSA
jgi:hypothetical protein